MSKTSRLACALSLVAAVACQKATDDPAEENAAALTATYISGHLGDAGRCVPSPASEAAILPPGDQAGAPVACDTNCPEPQPYVCMAPMVTLQVTNTGDTRIETLEVGEVILLEDGVALETLEGGEITVAPEGLPFVGLDAGASVQLFVSLSLPVGAFDDARVHRVQVELRSTPSARVEVTTPEISPMPAIAT